MKVPDKSDSVADTQCVAVVSLFVCREVKHCGCGYLQGIRDSYITIYFYPPPLSLPELQLILARPGGRPIPGQQPWHLPHAPGPKQPNPNTNLNHCSQGEWHLDSFMPEISGYIWERVNAQHLH